MKHLTTYFNEFYHNLSERWLTYTVAIVVLIIGFFLATKIGEYVKKRSDRNVANKLTATFISQLVRIVIKLVTIIFFLRIIGFSDFTKNMLAGAGILTFVVGFAFKDIGENFLAGILLAFKSPFKVNDLVETLGIVGYVTDLTIRETQIKTLDGKDVFIPNGQIIKNPLFNYTIDGYLRYDFVIGLDYGSNVKTAIVSILDEVCKIEGVIHEIKKPTVTIQEFATSTINLRVYFWINTFESSSKTYHSGIKSEVMENVLNRLVKEKFSLPSDIIEIKNYGE